jgi:D-ribose pyranase
VKRTLLLNAELSHQIALLGHGDALVIADAGLPIPAWPCRIDLALSRGVPGFVAVLQAVLSEMQVERALIADELNDAALKARLLAPLGATPLESIPHARLKALCAGARAIVRTGECTPFANVVLIAGVHF